MVKLFLVLLVCGLLLGGSYAAARFTAGGVVGDDPKDLGPLTTHFAYSGIPNLPGKPRGWVISYPQAKDFAPKGADIWVSVTGQLLGTRPADLADRLAAKKRAAEP